MSADDTARLDEWAALADAATEGPWLAEYSAEAGTCVLPHDAESTAEAVALTRLYLAAADAAFIAAAREAVPALIAMVRERDELRDALTARGDAAPAAQPVTMTADQAAAVFKVEGTHHFHGTRCLCGYESHGRARSATEHITGLTLAALGVEVTE